MVPVIRVNFGLAVRTGAAKPDVSSAEAFKRALLAARTILITDPATGGISGVHFMGVLERLGIVEEMKGKLVPNRGGGFHAERVAKGEADLAVQAEHEIRCVKGATFLPYPVVFQQTIVFLGGIGSASGNVAAAKAYLHYVTGSETDNTYSAHCLRRG
jgi:molybdate transport system substrate-binding protein